ncbi:MAG: ChaN family lipoprotein [Terriglobales bacterium]
MDSKASLRLRRSAAQMHALTQLQREIRASDPHIRRKYLRDFSDAYRSYESVLSSDQLFTIYGGADVLLVGDYHALPASQRFAAALVRELAQQERPVVLGVETIFARDQYLLDLWRQGRIDAQELRAGIRYDQDWGYDWEPFFELLESARQHAFSIYALDCKPRNDLRKIGARDRHAANRIAEIRARHPDARVVVLFGESHLAPKHLPELLRARRPQDRMLTVLQNVDTLYWLAAGERHERVEAVRVAEDVVCVFNSTPLEKYESYRICLERWREERESAPDYAPAFYNMVEALLRFLNINRRSPRNGVQPVPLDLLQVHCRTSNDRLRRLLLHKGADQSELNATLARIETQGTCYVPRTGAVFARNFQLVHGAEQAARFVHHICRGAKLDTEAAGAEERFYTRTMEEALAYFGSRALYPVRPAVRQSHLYELYSMRRESVEELGICSYREFMQLVDFLVLHKDYETNLRHYRRLPDLLREGPSWGGERFDYATQQLGYMLGSELYDAYIAGRIAKRFLRALFFRNLDKPGAARIAYFATVKRLRKKMRSSQHSAISTQGSAKFLSQS